jgi:LDH2 family malate/lactate/ureidoglycolate dehydrogenase
MPRVTMNDLVEFGTRLLVKKGLPEADARYIAEIAATTEAGGVSTHGAVLFTTYDAQVGASIDPTARPRVVRERGATALIDGQRVFGHLAWRLAADLAVRKARELGVAMVGVRNTSWIAGLGTFLIPIARQGLFAQLWAQSSQCQDSVPQGGIDARFSTNPVALAFPTAGEPVVADFSTSVFSMGKVSQWAAEGRRAPEKVFYDKHGTLTDDPKVVREGGGMLCWGQHLTGHKGYAFAFWGEALTAMAGGSCNNPHLEQRQSFNLTVIDPEAFAGMDYYRREMERFVAWVRSSRTAPGVDKIRLPGERMLQTIAASRRNGIEIGQGLLDRLNEVAKRNGLEPLKTA